MNFSNWLNLNEAQWGRSFGRSLQPKTPEHSPATPNPAVRTTVPTQRHDNRFQDINSRVQYGKSIEKKIFDSLIQCGLKLREPTRQEDMHSKIDGWWTINGTEKPIQIKYRDTGDDILFEVMKDYYGNVPGRDMIGKAEYYAVLNKTGGTIVMVSVAEAKKLIYSMKEMAEKQGFDERGNFRMGQATLRIRPDPSSGQEKLMAYIPVSALKQVIPPCSAKIGF